MISMSKAKQSSILKFIRGTVPNPTVVVAQSRQQEEVYLNPRNLDKGRPGETDCIEDDRQAPVNDRHLVSLEPAASVQNADEIPEKFHPPSMYKFPKWKFGSKMIT